MNRPHEPSALFGGALLEVLRLLAPGHLYKTIADSLDMSLNTLRSHIRAIYDKLHVHSRAEATLKLLDPY